MERSFAKEPELPRRDAGAGKDLLATAEALPSSARPGSAHGRIRLPPGTCGQKPRSAKRRVRAARRFVASHRRPAATLAAIAAAAATPPRLARAAE